MTKLDVIDLDHEALDGLLGPPVEAGTREYPAPGTWPKGKTGAPVPAMARLLHVVSSRACGEVRAYWLPEDDLTAHVRGPCYTGRWPLVDALVERATGRRVVPYAVDARGMVIHAPTAPDDADGQVSMFRWVTP